VVNFRLMPIPVRSGAIAIGGPFVSYVCVTRRCGAELKLVFV
jgi:hypothetical protein